MLLSSFQYLFIPFTHLDFRCYVGDKRSERWRPCDRSLVIDVGILRFVKNQNIFIYVY